MANDIYKITEDFEKDLLDYTGDPHVICLDNQSNGLFLSLYYEHHVSKTLTNDTITIPPRTYGSVPCQDVSKKK